MIKPNKDYEEYSVLVNLLEEITQALEGNCNDIDCDRYVYRELLKKKYRPILEHNYSCIDKLKREKQALMRLLSMKKFKKFRYKKCSVCSKKIDSLGNSFSIVSFTRPRKIKKRIFYEYKGFCVHKKCKKKVIVPKGWDYI